jgi:hypothetical protein
MPCTADLTVAGVLVDVETGRSPAVDAGQTVAAVAAALAQHLQSVVAMVAWAAAAAAGMVTGALVAAARGVAQPLEPVKVGAAVAAAVVLRPQAADS